MNTLPHIGSTLAQRRALSAYQLQQDALEADRRERIDAALQVDALLVRIRENDAAGCAECDADEPTPLWLLALGATLWTLLLVIGLGLVAVKCGWLS
jgi:hypothetical protein